jgi:hypothetical protein
MAGNSWLSSQMAIVSAPAKPIAAARVIIVSLSYTTQEGNRVLLR